MTTPSSGTGSFSQQLPSGRKVARGAANTASATMLAGVLAHVAHSYGYEGSPEFWIGCAGLVIMAWNLVANFFTPIVEAIQKRIVDLVS